MIKYIIIGVLVAAVVAVAIFFIVSATQNHSQNAGAPMLALQQQQMLNAQAMANAQLINSTNPLIPVNNGTAQISTNSLTPAQRTRIRDPAAFQYYQDQLQAAAANLSTLGLSTSDGFIGFNMDLDQERMAILPQCTQDPNTGIVTCTTPTWSSSAAPAST